MTALDQAIDVCERAGLIAQSIQATAARAVVLALAGRHEQARESASEAAELAERLHYPIGRAAALEAQGATAAEAPQEGARLLERGRARPGRTSSARSRRRAAGLLAGQRLAGDDPERSRELLEQAAAEHGAPGRGAPGGSARAAWQPRG